MNNKNWKTYARFLKRDYRKNKDSYESLKNRIYRVIQNKNVLMIGQIDTEAEIDLAASAASLTVALQKGQLNKQNDETGICLNLRYREEDYSNLSFSSAIFDAVILTDIIRSFDDLNALFSEVHRVLKDDGSLLTICSLGSSRKNLLQQKMLNKAGFAPLHFWNTHEEFARFLKENSFEVSRYMHQSGPASLLYTQSVRENVETAAVSKELKDPEYYNWMPQSMIISFGALSAALALGAVGTHIFAKNMKKPVKAVVETSLTAAAVGCGAYAVWCAYAREQFSYDGHRKLSRQIIEGISDYVDLPDGGVGLDVGCGSGALTIACAKKNPNATIFGVDTWKGGYADYSREVCQSNAEAEEVENTIFVEGNAVKLKYHDETFDCVTSNYVYHNIAFRNKQKVLKESLRVLKKGGTFVIHDLFSPARYGDMEKFMQELRDAGYQDVRLIDTTKGLFMTQKEANRLMLGGSKLLIGRK